MTNEQYGNIDAMQISKYDDELRAAQEQIAEIASENARLRDALGDAIESPLGIVPRAADEFYDYQRGIVRAALREKDG